MQQEHLLACSYASLNKSLPQFRPFQDTGEVLNKACWAQYFMKQLPLSLVVLSQFHLNPAWLETGTQKVNDPSKCSKYFEGFQTTMHIFGLYFIRNSGVIKTYMTGCAIIYIYIFFTSCTQIMPVNIDMNNTCSTITCQSRATLGMQLLTHAIAYVFCHRAHLLFSSFFIN